MSKVQLLVVEDDTDMREMLTEALEEEGFAVQSAGSGAQALKLAEAMPFDLLITDVRMGGIDGLETLAGVKSLHPAIRSIVITGYASHDAPVRAIKLQACDYLYKPFSLAELLAAVEHVLQAEAEREKSQRLLTSLASGFKDLETWTAESERVRAFGSFYVSARSRNLGMAAALQAWDWLEQAEFALAMELVSADVSLQPTGFPERAPGQVSRSRFADFYKRLQSGDIPAHQLTVAAYLRSLEVATLARSPDLSALYEAIWGEPGPEVLQAQ